MISYSQFKKGCQNPENLVIVNDKNKPIGYVLPGGDASVVLPKYKAQAKLAMREMMYESDKPAFSYPPYIYYVNVEDDKRLADALEELSGYLKGMIPQLKKSEGKVGKDNREQFHIEANLRFAKKFQTIVDLIEMGQTGEALAMIEKLPTSLSAECKTHWHGKKMSLYWQKKNGQENPWEHLYEEIFFDFPCQDRRRY